MPAEQRKRFELLNVGKFKGDEWLYDSDRGSIDQKVRPTWGKRVGWRSPRSSIGCERVYWGRACLGGWVDSEGWGRGRCSKSVSYAKGRTV